MSKQEKAPGPNPSPKLGPSPVTAPERCPAESCGKKPQRMHFCEEHFNWFKAGLVNRMGERPSDFDKKYQSYKQKKSA